MSKKVKNRASCIGCYNTKLLSNWLVVQISIEGYHSGRLGFSFCLDNLLLPFLLCPLNKKLCSLSFLLGCYFWTKSWREICTIELSLTCKILPPTQSMQWDHLWQYSPTCFASIAAVYSRPKLRSVYKEKESYKWAQGQSWHHDIDNSVAIEAPTIDTSSRMM